MGRRRYIAGGLLLCVALCLSLFVVRTYVRVYQRDGGWTRLIAFGSLHEPVALPRLQQTVHYVDPDFGMRFGYDGQFYAQLAIDPSLRDRAFDQALDSPAYRARRIGLPVLSFLLGLGQPQWIIQAYALANLMFWFLLLAALTVLFRPWTGQQLLCLAAALVSYGVIVSMEGALIDLPAATLIFAGAVIGSWGGYALFAGAALTRETCLLAAFGFLDLRRPWHSAAWKRNLGLLALTLVPLFLWLIYVNHRFGAERVAGSENFGWPMHAMCTQLGTRIYQCRHQVPAASYRKFRWLYKSHTVHEVLTIAATCVQGLYLVCRRDVDSAYWRTGVCYLALGCFFGSAVWEGSGAAARVLLPMTICFYLLLARERAAWFWPFFIFGSLSIPYGLYEFWGFA